MDNQGMKWVSMMIIGCVLAVILSSTGAMADSYDGCLARGWQARQEKKFDAAIEAYRCAVAANGDSEDANLGLLHAYLGKGDYGTAVTLGDELVARFPDNLLIAKGAALANYYARHYERAAALYGAVLAAGGEDSEMRLGRGLALRAAGKNAEARQECLKCARDYARDSRYALCVAELERTVRWRFTPSLSFTYLNFSNSWDKKHTLSGSTGVDISHESGFGLSLEGGYLASQYTPSWGLVTASIRNSVPGLAREILTQLLTMPLLPPPPQVAADIANAATATLVQSRLSAADGWYHEFWPGLGISYTRPAYWLLMHWRLIRESDGNLSNVVSVHGAYQYRFVSFGAGLDVGIFNGFQTIQATPELGFTFLKRYRITLTPLFQYSTGTIASSATSLGFRPAVSLGFSAALDYVTISTAWYLGNRWYPIEERGTVVWNSDEEYRWGGSLGLKVLPGKQVSPFITLRLDRGIRQYGLSHSFYRSGITTGLTFSF